ncbi:MAG: autotransporter domain-containing protein [Spirochaetaceae bacterium]|jgi:hypothetical protein|nr:autotransporter domain-containing protein [Spirochaetaceae bacterium]
MKKKMVVTAVCLFGLSSGLFAQSEQASVWNAITIDAVPLVQGFIAGENVEGDADTKIFGIAASYERLLVSGYSIGIRLDLYTGEVSGADVTYFGMDAHGRWYPLSTNHEKLYLDVGIGFSNLDQEGSDDPVFTGLTFALKTGWRQVIADGFFLEPSLGYVLAKSNQNSMSFSPIGWQLGFGLGFVF